MDLHCRPLGVMLGMHGTARQNIAMILVGSRTYFGAWAAESGQRNCRMVFLTLMNRRMDHTRRRMSSGGPRVPARFRSMTPTTMKNF